MLSSHQLEYDALSKTGDGFIANALLIDGFEPNELLSMNDLDAYVVAGRPIVFSVGEAKVLAEFSKSDTVLSVNIGGD